MLLRPKESKTTQSVQAFLIFAVIMYIALKMIMKLKEKGWIKNNNNYVISFFLFGLAFLMLMFSIVMGPLIFKDIGYEITGKGSITAADSIGYILESILAATFAGLTFIKTND